MLAYLLLGFILSSLFYLINVLVYQFNRKNVTQNELMITYECGFDAIQNQARTQHSINYYLIALLYVIFDLEIALLLPALASLTQIGITGGVLLVLIMTLLTSAFIYEIKLGTFNFVNPLQ